MQNVHVTFPDLDLGEANQAARQLRDELLELGEPNLSVHVQDPAGDTLDLGSTLVLLLGTPAIVVAAKALSAYVAARAQSILITYGDVSIMISGDASKDPEVISAVSKLLGVSPAHPQPAKE